STSAGKVAEVLLKRGDKVSAGSIIARVDAAAQAGAKAAGATASAPANAEATFAESFDADELERTVTQPILKAATVPPSTAAPAGANGASQPSGRGEPAAPAARAPSPAPASPAPAPSARSESAGDTVRMPIPDLSRGARDPDFNRSTQLLVLGSGP